QWAALGWERSFLGYPLTDETGAPDGVGRFNHFQGGSIYWTPATGAHEVHGAIREQWAALGWEKSFLGYPLTDETPTDDGSGRYNQFQRGGIRWRPSSGPVVVPEQMIFSPDRNLEANFVHSDSVRLALLSDGSIVFEGSV